MQRTMIDYALTSLLVLHVGLMVIWGWLLLTTDLATKNNVGIGLVILTLILAYHLLRWKRNQLQRRAKELQHTR